MADAVAVAAETVAARVGHDERVRIAGQADTVFLTQLQEMFEPVGRDAFQESEPAVLHLLPRQLTAHQPADGGAELLVGDTVAFEVEEDAFLSEVADKLMRVDADFGEPAESLGGVLDEDDAAHVE